MTWLPADVLGRIGVEVFKKDHVFVMANGRLISRNVGIGVIRAGKFKTVDEVVFAQPGDTLLLGARTLEGFNARLDARGRRLVPGGPTIAAAMQRTRRLVVPAAPVERRKSLTGCGSFAWRRGRPPLLPRVTIVTGGGV